MGFALGAMAGCLLGATEEPVEKAALAASAAAPFQPLMEDMGTFGALGFGTVVGATALTVAMTSVVAGVLLAAAVASPFVSSRSCSSSSTEGFGLWASAGIAGAFGTTLSGATLGVLVEWIVKSFGMMGLLGALSMASALKPPLNLLFKLVWEQGEACCSQGSADWAEEQERMQVRELQQRQRVAVQMERRILALETGRVDRDDQSAWMAERRRREEMERSRMQREEAEMEQQTLRGWINTAVSKHVDLLAFSGIPMTVVAMVTSGFGLLGYGNHQLVFVAILILVLVTAYALLKTSNFQFWMLIGCMATLVTFIIAILTLHAGQVVLTAAMKMQAAAQNRSREGISALMKRQACEEALSTAFLAAQLCQLALGATVGGPLVRHGAGEVKVIVGAALVAVGLLGGVLVSSPVLGEGGRAGALLGVLGATGVSVGAAAALSGRCSSWAGTLATAAGLAAGAARAGRRHVLNIGLQLPVAFVFAKTNLF